MFSIVPLLFFLCGLAFDCAILVSVIDRWGRGERKAVVALAAGECR